MNNRVHMILKVISIPSSQLQYQVTPKSKIGYKLPEPACVQ
jgi:hypothetical protein